jgi:hypothetical protein
MMSEQQSMVLETAPLSAFQQFHKDNPHVYTTLVQLCCQFRDKHGKNAKTGIGMLWEKMRWDFRMSTEHVEFKLNNNYRSMYARMIMQKHVQLDGIFETRSLRS